MRSIHLLSTHIYGSLLGGGDRVFIELCKCWQKRGINIDILCPTEAPPLFEGYGLRANCTLISDSFIEKSRSVLTIPIVFLIRSLKALKWRPLYGRQQMIYTPGDFICIVIPAVFAKLLKRKSIWVTNVFFVIPSPSFRGLSLVMDILSFSLQRFSFSLMKRYADLVVVLNSTTEQQLIDYGIPEKKIFKSSGGVDIAKINASPKDTLTYDGCYVGRIHPGKGVMDLGSIWKTVIAENPKARLAIVGTGAPHYIKMLSDDLKAKGVDSNVELLGFKQSPFTIMKSSKVLLYPDYEAGYGWGLSVGEALACGVPVVAYNMPVYKEAYSGGTILVETGNTGSFGKSVLDLLNNEEKRRKLGEEGKACVQKYEWKNIADNLLTALQNVERKNRGKHHA